MTTSATWLELAWNQLWQLTAVIVVVGLLAALLARRRPHLAHALWLIVLVKALTPPVWTSRAGIFSWVLLEHEPPPATAAPQPRPVPPPYFAPSDDSFSEFLADESAAETLSPPSPLRAPVKSAAPPPVPWLTLPRVLAAAWCFGFVVLSIVIGRKCALLRGQLRAAPPAPSDVMQLVAELADKLGHRRPPRTTIVDDALGPAALGAFHPTILLPRSLVTSSDRGQLSAIVAHELVHLRRRDPWIGLTQLIVQLLWWFHPLVWWSNRQMRRSREQACDEETVARLHFAPTDYAAALVELAARKAHWTASLLLAMGREGLTTRRVEHLLRPGQTFRRRTSPWAWITCALLAVAVLPGAGLLLPAPSAADQPPQPTQPVIAQEPLRFDPALGTLAKITFDPRAVAALEKLQAFGVESSWDAPIPPATEARLYVSVVRDWPADAEVGQLWAQVGPIDTLHIYCARVTPEQIAQILAQTDARYIILGAATPAHLQAAGASRRCRWLNLDFDPGELPAQALRDSPLLPQLEWMWVSPATNEHAEALAGAQQLRSLSLDGSTLDGRACAAVARLSSLEELMLQLSYVEGRTLGFTDEALAPLGSLATLKKLTLVVAVKGKAAEPQLDLPWIGGLKTLESLLVTQRVSDAALAEVSRLPSLASLDLHVEGATGAGLRALAASRSLRSLRMRNGQFAPSDLAALAQNPNWLALSFFPFDLSSTTRITDEVVRAWEGLQQLQVLAGCELTAAGFKSVSRLASLRMLTARGTIDDAILEDLRRLERLEVLALGGDLSRVTDAGLAHLGHSSFLRYLSLSGTTATDQGLSNLGALSVLAYLDLSGSKVTGTGFAKFRHPERLRELKLSDTRFNAAGLAELRRTPNVYRLDLAGADVADEGLDALRALRPYYDLDLSRTRITDAAAPVLQDLAKHRLDRIVVNETALSEVVKAELPITESLYWAMPNQLHFEIESGNVTFQGQWAQALPFDAEGMAAQTDASADEVRDERAQARRQLAAWGVNTWQFPPDTPGADPSLWCVSLEKDLPADADVAGLWAALGPLDQLIVYCPNVPPARIEEILAQTDVRFIALHDVTPEHLLAAGQSRQCRSLLVNLEGGQLPPAALREARLLPQLEKLILVQATNEHADALAPAQQLRSLHIEGPTLDDGACPGIARLTSLEELILQQGREDARDPGFSDKALAELAALVRLKKLIVTGSGRSPSSMVLDLAWIAPLENLVELTSGQPVSDAAAGAIARLPKLTDVRLFEGKLTGEGLRLLAASESLRSLHLSSAGFAPGELAVLGQNPRWRSLYIDSETNPITAEDVQAWEGMQELHVLTLSGAELSTPAFESIAKLSNLRALEADGTIGDDALVSLSRLTQLEFVRLYGNLAGVSDASLAALSNIATLRFLELRGTSATDDGLRALGRLPQLASVGLPGSRITGSGLAAFQNPDAIRQLRFANTQFDASGLAQLQRMPNVRALDLLGTRIADQGLEALLALRHLYSLNISRTGVTDAAAPILRQLKQAGLETLVADETALSKSVREELDVEPLAQAWAYSGDVGYDVQTNEMSYTGIWCEPLPAEQTEPQPGANAAQLTRPTAPPAPEDLTPENQQKQHELLDQEYARVEAGFTEAHRQAAARLRERGAGLRYGPVRWQGGRVLAGPPKIDDAKAKTGVTLRSYDDATLADLRHLERLTTLIVETPVITDDELAQLTSLRTLETLSIEIRERGRVSSLQPPAGQKPLAMRGLGDLTRLRSLWSNVPITDDALAELARLPGLVSLEVDASALTDEGYRRHFSLPPSIKRLELNRSKLPAEALAAVGRLTQLQGLFVGATDEKALAAAMRNLPDLRAVVAGPGSDEVLQALAGCENLQWLNLDGDAKVTDEGIAALANLGQLRVLYLECQNQAITDQGAATLGKLPKLEIVRVNNASIGDDGLAAFAGLPALWQLTLRDCRVTGRGVAKLADLAELRELSLAGCPLADPEMDGFGRLKQLWRLDLSRTPLGDAGVAPLAELKQLEDLDLSKTRVTDAALPTLRQLRPATNISLADTPGTTKEGRKSIDAEIGFLDYIAIPRLNLETGLIEPGHKPVSRRAFAQAAATDVIVAPATADEDSAQPADDNPEQALSPERQNAIAALRAAGAKVGVFADPGKKPGGVPYIEVVLGPKWQSAAGHEKLFAKLGRFNSLGVRCVAIPGEELARLAPHAACKSLSLTVPSDEHLSATAGMKSVQDLGIDDLSGLSPEAFAAWPLLPTATYLQLTGVKSGHGAGIAKATKLRTLRIRGESGITDGEIVAACNPMTELQSLTLQLAALTNEGLAPLARQTGLTHLHLISLAQEAATLKLPWLGGLKELQSLSLINMPIVDDTLQAAAAAGKLRNLEFHGGAASDAGLTAVATCKELRILAIFEAHFSNAALARLGRLSDLEVLTIMQPRDAITDEAVAAWRGLTKMRILSVETTLLTGASIEALAGMKDLAHLDLGGTTDLGDDDLATLATLPKLKTLELGSGAKRVTDRGIEALSVVRELAALGIGGTQVTDRGLARLASLPKLGRLQLDEAPLTGAGFAEFGEQSRLASVWLRATRFDDQGAQSIARLPRLQRLFVSDTPLTDAGVKVLAQLKLVHLDLSGTPVTDEIVPVLRGMKDRGMQICDLDGTKVSEANRQGFEPGILGVEVLAVEDDPLDLPPAMESGEETDPGAVEPAKPQTDEAKNAQFTGTFAVAPSEDPPGPPGVIAALREAGAYVAKWPTYDSDSTNPKPSVTLARPWQPTPEHALLLGRLGPVSAFNVMCQEVTPEALKQALAHIDAELLQLVEADADHLAAADGFRGRELTLSLVPDVTADILAAWPPLAMATELNAIKFAANQVEGLRAAGKLSRLYLDARDASDEIVPIVASLRQLEHLHLVGSIFTDQGLAPLAKLTALTELYVGSREVERNPLQAPWLVPLVNLRRVQIDDMSDEALAVTGKLPHLERITLMGRSVTDAGLRALCESPSLRSLTIYLAEPFTAAGLKEIGRLWTLEALDINGNRTPIDDDVLAAWADLTRLRSLQLTRTQISSRGAQVLAGYKDLVVLELQGTNDLADEDLSAFGQFANLRSLSLGRGLARVTDRGIGAIAQQPELREFKASGTQATEAGLAALCPLPKLSVLHLADAPGVTGATLVDIRDPLLLKDLSLAGTATGDATLQTIARFKNLRTLNLSRAAVTDEGIKALAELPSLSELDLAGTKVTDAVLPTLDAMRKQGMQLCDLSGTAVGATNRERFQPAYGRGRLVFPGEEDEVGVRRFDE